MPTAYQTFMKENLKKFSHLPDPKERMKACAEMYRQQHGIAKKSVAKKAPVEKKSKSVGKKKKLASDRGQNVESVHAGNFWDDFKEGIDLPLALARKAIFA